jgi:hypothetical protein
MQTRQLLLSRIESFLTRHGYGRVRFSVEATGYREFVRELERGDSVTLRRIEKAEAFMSRFEGAAQHEAREIGAAGGAEEQAQVGDRVLHRDDDSLSFAARQREALP